MCQPTALLSVFLLDTVSTVSVAYAAWSHVAVLHAASADCLQLSRHNHFEPAWFTSTAPAAAFTKGREVTLLYRPHVGCVQASIFEPNLEVWRLTSHKKWLFLTRSWNVDVNVTVDQIKWPTRSKHPTVAFMCLFLASWHLPFSISLSVLLKFTIFALTSQLSMYMLPTCLHSCVMLLLSLSFSLSFCHSFILLCWAIRCCKVPLCSSYSRCRCNHKAHPSR